MKMCPSGMISNHLNPTLMSVLRFLILAAALAAGTAAGAAAQTQSPDWPARQRYRLANTELAPPATGERRVVFMGNSITEGRRRALPRCFLASRTSVAVSVDKPRRRCWCDFARM